MPLRKSPSSIVRGFTLVELLVVIGVIAVLIGMLLPSLNRARESANRTQCASNMRQIANSIVMYNVDNRDKFPNPSPNSAPCTADWIGWKGVYRNTITDIQEGSLKQYLAPRSKMTTAILTCPTDVISAHVKDPGGYQYPSSYSLNWMICEPRDYTNPPRFRSSIFDAYVVTDVRGNPNLTRSKIHRPTEIILIIDENTQTVDDGCWAPNKTHNVGFNLLSIRHDKSRKEDQSGVASRRGNVAYCDAHVDYIPQKQAYLQRNWDPTKGGLQSLP